MNQINRYAGGGCNVNMGLKTRIIVGINYNVLIKGISQVLPQPVHVIESHIWNALCMLI